MSHPSSPFDQLALLRSALSAPRLAHAQHAVQQIAASLATTRKSFYISACQGGSADPPADLIFWTSFVHTSSLPTCDWWNAFSTTLKDFTLGALSSALFLPPPTVSLLDSDLPNFPPDAKLAEVFLDGLWESLCAMGIWPLAQRTRGRLLGLTDPSSRIFCNTLPTEAVTIHCLQLSSSHGTYTLWHQGDTLLFVSSTDPLATRPPTLTPSSNFLHPAIAWPWWDKGLPSFHATSLPQRLSAWKRILGPFLGPAALAILTDGFVIPRVGRPAHPVHVDNHPTVRNAPDLIDRIVAKYLITGIAELLPPGHPPPAGIHALGLVPKKSTEEPWRLIHDCRPENIDVIDWPSQLHGLSASSYLFSRRAWVFTLDFKAAYYTIPLKGCGGGLRLTGRRLPSGAPEYIMGCSTRDGSCLGGCDKDRLGFRWRENMRMNCSPFGGKVSGNALKILTDAWARRWRKLGLRNIIWVDDFLGIVDNPHPPPSSPPAPPVSPIPDLASFFQDCPGFDKCAFCQKSFLSACDVREQVIEELADLGWLTNEKDSGLPDMQGQFVGTNFDTEIFVFLMAELKREKLHRRVQKLIRLGSFSRRRLSKFRGKMVWFTCCVRFTEVMLRECSAWIGNPADDASWDIVTPPPLDVSRELSFWGSNLRRLATAARAIIRIPPSFAYKFWLDGRSVDHPSSPTERSLDVAGVVFVDASVHGFGFTFFTSPHSSPVVQVHSPPVDHPWDEQVHREAFAFSEAAAFTIPRVSGRALIVVSDCLPVVKAAARGSHSPPLQATAVSIVHLSIAFDVFVHALWTPGSSMVTLGVDDLSRTAAIDAHDVSLNPVHLQFALDMAEAYLGARPSVDWFATAASATLPRYWTRFSDVGTEGEDALSAESWAMAHCPCGSCHTEIGYFFPPIPLLASVWAKIKLDGARGVMIVPVTPGAPWWPLLEASAVFYRELGEARDVLTCRSKAPRHYTGDLRWACVVFRFNPPDDMPPQACPRFRSAPLPSPSAILSHATKHLLDISALLTIPVGDRPTPRRQTLHPDHAPGPTSPPMPFVSSGRSASAARHVSVPVNPSTGGPEPFQRHPPPHFTRSSAGRSVAHGPATSSPAPPP
jgi:hypothetical protein